MRAELSSKASLEEITSALKIQVDRLSVEVSTDPNDEQNHALRRTIGQLRDDLKCQKDENRTLKNDRKKSNDQIRKLKKRLTASDTKIQALSEALDDKSARCKELSKKNDKALADLAESKKHTEQIETFKSNENERLRRQIEQLKNTPAEKEAIIAERTPLPATSVSTQTTPQHSNTLSRRLQICADRASRLPLANFDLDTKAMVVMRPILENDILAIDSIKLVEAQQSAQVCFII
jgi:chromosome segregation ATPase